MLGFESSYVSIVFRLVHSIFVSDYFIVVGHVSSISIGFKTNSPLGFACFVIVVVGKSNNCESLDLVMGFPRLGIIGTRV